MTSRLLGSAAIAATVAWLVSTPITRLDAQDGAPVVRTHTHTAASPFSPPRTPDGHPDMQGYWTNGTYTPLERPAEFGTKEFFTREEALAYAKRRDDQLRAQPRDNIHYDDAIWQGEREVKGLTSLRTSLIYDPPDGRIPPLTAEGQQRAEARAAARKLRGPADNAQMRTLGERCIMWAARGAADAAGRLLPQPADRPGPEPVRGDAGDHPQRARHLPRRPPAAEPGHSASTVATRADGGKATRWWSRRPTSTTSPSSAARRRRSR